MYNVDIPCSLQSLSLTRGSDFKLIYAMVGKDSDLNNVSTIEYAYFFFLTYTYFIFGKSKLRLQSCIHLQKKSGNGLHGFGMVTPFKVFH